MKIGILALGRPTFDVQYAKERLAASLNYLNTTNHNIFGSCELLLNEQDADEHGRKQRTALRQ